MVLSTDEWKKSLVEVSLRIAHLVSASLNPKILWCGGRRLGHEFDSFDCSTIMKELLEATPFERRSGGIKALHQSC